MLCQSAFGNLCFTNQLCFCFLLYPCVNTGDVKCFKDDCYPLAFGVPAALMVMAIALFWCGRHKYKRVPQTGNIVWQVTKAISYALKKKITTKVSDIYCK